MGEIDFADFGEVFGDNQTIGSDDESIDTAATCRSDYFGGQSQVDENDQGDKNNATGGGRGGAKTRLSLEARRQDELKSQSIINALNLFILQAGNICKGKKLSLPDETRLRVAANEVGVSRNVVDALIEQTADQNAIVDYCMNSDDVFARKMKEDPRLSRILHNRGQSDPDKGDGLNISHSVWRIFMHKIIKQFLNEQNIQLADIFEKSAHTKKLYEETLSIGREKSKFGLPMIPRDYTEARKKVYISEDEANQARREASEEMEKFQLSRNPHVYDLVNGASIQIHRELPRLMSRKDFDVQDARGDELRMVQCATERDSPFMPRIHSFDPSDNHDSIPFQTKQEALLIQADSFLETIDFPESRDDDSRISVNKSVREPSVVQHLQETKCSISDLDIADDLDYISNPPQPDATSVSMMEPVDEQNKLPEQNQSPSLEGIDQEIDKKKSVESQSTPKREVLQTSVLSSVSEANAASAVKKRISNYEKGPTSPQPRKDLPQKDIGKLEQDSFSSGNVLQARAKFEKQDEQPQTDVELLASPQPQRGLGSNVLQARALFEKKDEEPQTPLEPTKSPQPKRSSKILKFRILFDKKEEEPKTAEEVLTSPEPQKGSTSNVLRARALFDKKNEEPQAAKEILASPQLKTSSNGNVLKARDQFEKKDEELHTAKEILASPQLKTSSNGNILRARALFDKKNEEPQAAKEILASPQLKTSSNGNVLQAREKFEKKEEELYTAKEILASPQLKTSSNGNVLQARDQFEKKEEELYTAKEILASPQLKTSSSGNVLQARAQFEKKDEGSHAKADPQMSSNDDVKQARTVFETNDHQPQVAAVEMNRTRQTKNIQNILATSTHTELENPYASIQKRSDNRAIGIGGTTMENMKNVHKKNVRVVEKRVAIAKSVVDTESRADLLQSNGIGDNIPCITDRIEHQTRHLDAREDNKTRMQQREVNNIQVSDYRLKQKSFNEMKQLELCEKEFFMAKKSGYENHDNTETAPSNSQLPLHVDLEINRTDTTEDMDQESYLTRSYGSEDRYDDNNNAENILQNINHRLCENPRLRLVDDVEEDYPVEVSEVNDESDTNCMSKNLRPDTSFSSDQNCDLFLTNQVENMVPNSDRIADDQSKNRRADQLQKSTGDSQREHRERIRRFNMRASQKKKYTPRSNTFKVQVTGDDVQSRQKSDEIVNEMMDAEKDSGTLLTRPIFKHDKSDFNQNQIILMANDQNDSLDYVTSTSDDSTRIHNPPTGFQLSEQSPIGRETASDLFREQESYNETTKEEKCATVPSDTVLAYTYDVPESSNGNTWAKFESNNTFREQPGGQLLLRDISERSNRVESGGYGSVAQQVAKSTEVVKHRGSKEAVDCNGWATFESENMFNEQLEESRSHDRLDKKERVHIAKRNCAPSDRVDSVAADTTFLNNNVLSRNDQNINMTHQSQEHAATDAKLLPFQNKKMPRPQSRRVEPKTSSNKTEEVVGGERTEFLESFLLSDSSSIHLESLSDEQRTFDHRVHLLENSSFPRHQVYQIPPKELPRTETTTERDIHRDHSWEFFSSNFKSMNQNDVSISNNASKNGRLEEVRRSNNESEQSDFGNSLSSFNHDPRDISFMQRASETSGRKASNYVEYENRLAEIPSKVTKRTDAIVPSIARSDEPAKSTSERRYRSRSIESMQGKKESNSTYPFSVEEIDPKSGKDDHCLTLNDHTSILEQDQGIRNHMKNKGDLLEEYVEAGPEPPANNHQEIDDKSEERRHLEALGEFLINYRLDDRPKGTKPQEGRVNPHREINGGTERQDHSEFQNSAHENNPRDGVATEWPEMVSKRFSMSTVADNENASINTYERTPIDNADSRADPPKIESVDSHDISWPSDDDGITSPRRSISSNMSVQLRADHSTNREDDSCTPRSLLHRQTSIDDDITKDKYRETVSDSKEYFEERQQQHSYRQDRQYPEPVVRVLDRPLLDLDDDEYYDAIEVERRSTNELGYLEPEPTAMYSGDPESYQMGLKSDALPDPSPKGNGKLSPKGRRRLSYATPEPKDAVEVPEGATEEELKLLNHFIEVASSNFNGNTLSADSESRVRAAALKIGLTSKFVDQLLHQTIHQKEENDPARLSFIPSEQLPPSYGSEQPPPHTQERTHVQNDNTTYRNESSDYVTNDYDDNGTSDGVEHYSRRAAKERRRHERAPEECSAWDSLGKTVGFLANLTARACGMEYHSRRDEESVVSALSWDEDNTGARRRRSERPRDTTEDFAPNYPVDHQQQHYDHGRTQRVTFAPDYHGGEEGQGQEVGAGRNDGSGSPPRPKIRQLV